MMTPEEYFQNALAYGKQGPDGKRRFLVIDSNRFETPWLMWMLYFKAIGLESSVSEMKKGWKTRMTATVPTEDPHQFDGDFMVYAEEIDNARRWLNGPAAGPEDKRKAFATTQLQTVRSAMGRVKRAKAAHDKRGDDLAEVRELILEQRRKSPEYAAEQAEAERQAVAALMRRAGGSDMKAGKETA